MRGTHNNIGKIVWAILLGLFLTAARGADPWGLVPDQEQSWEQATADLVPMDRPMPTTQPATGWASIYARAYGAKEKEAAGAHAKQVLAEEIAAAANVTPEEQPYFYLRALALLTK